MSKPVLPAKRRRKGFESVRKGYRSADARLMFFENGLLYCKLTAASAIQKGLLHVSFVAVRSRCRCALKKAFLYRIALYELKKFAFSANQKVFFCRKFYEPHSKPFLRTKTSFARAFLRCPQKFPFSQTKSLSFAQTFP